MNSLRVLIVDDSSVMRKIVERTLRQAGLESLIVHEAGSGSLRGPVEPMRKRYDFSKATRNPYAARLRLRAERVRAHQAGSRWLFRASFGRS